MPGKANPLQELIKQLKETSLVRDKKRAECPFLSLYIISILIM